MWPKRRCFYNGAQPSGPSGRHSAAAKLHQSSRLNNRHGLVAHSGPWSALLLSSHEPLTSLSQTSTGLIPRTRFTRVLHKTHVALLLPGGPRCGSTRP